MMFPMVRYIQNTDSDVPRALGWFVSGPPGFTCWISFAPVFSFIQAVGSDFRLYDGSDLKTYLLMRWLGPDRHGANYFGK